MAKTGVMPGGVTLQYPIGHMSDGLNRRQIIIATCAAGAVAGEEAGDFVSMAPTPMAAALNPDFELAEIGAASEAAAGEVRESFKELLQNLEHFRD